MMAGAVDISEDLYITLGAQPHGSHEEIKRCYQKKLLQVSMKVCCQGKTHMCIRGIISDFNNIPFDMNQRI